MPSSPSYSPQHFIGAMSGNSLDGIDVSSCLIHANPKQPEKIIDIEVISSNYSKYPKNLRIQIEACANAQFAQNSEQLQVPFANLLHLRKQITTQYLSCLNKHFANLSKSTPKPQALGLHGQTIFHQPAKKFTLQLLDWQHLATLFNIPIIGEFREADVARGGQGAPLAPLLHQVIFRKYSPCAIVNIGAFSNCTILSKSNQTKIAGDCGPGNVLLDQWFRYCHPNSRNEFDRGGKFAASGKVISTLLSKLKHHAFYRKLPPKSCGKEQFNLPKLIELYKLNSYRPQDVQATFCKLSAWAIAHTLTQCKVKKSAPVIICGGGAYNDELISQLRQEDLKITISDQLKLPANNIEATLFAYLAYLHHHQIKCNLASITGNRTPIILGRQFY